MPVENVELRGSQRDDAVGYSSRPKWSATEWKANQDQKKKQASPPQKRGVDEHSRHYRAGRGVPVTVK